MTPIFGQMRQGLAASVFPGGVLLVAHQNEIVCHEAFGFRMIHPKREKMQTETFFDLASLTKPLVTATLIARLYQQKLVDLQDPLVKYLPAFSGGPKNEVTLFHLLNHCAGLPAWQPYYQDILIREKKAPGFLGSAEAKQKVFKMANAENLISQPGESSCYSDIGFILLGQVIEKIYDMPLDRCFMQHIASPLNLSESVFPHTDRDHKQAGRISFAATEDSAWRKTVIVGEVHDDNAYVMGGAAGHAGLFATAAGVYQLVRAWIDSIQGSGFLSAEIASGFVSRPKDVKTPQGTSWALGWDTPSVSRMQVNPTISSSGHHFSASSFGHLGFTGTSIWVDLENALVVILLTNRVHPKRENDAIRSFRPKIHDTIFETVIHG